MVDSKGRLEFRRPLLCRHLLGAIGPFFGGWWIADGYGAAQNLRCHLCFLHHHLLVQMSISMGTNPQLTTEWRFSFGVCHNPLGDEDRCFWHGRTNVVSSEAMHIHTRLRSSNHISKYYRFAEWIWQMDLVSVQLNLHYLIWLTLGDMTPDF